MFTLLSSPAHRKDTIEDWLLRIRAEYLEMPGLALTLAQACRFWRLDDITGAALFGSLVDAGFLRYTGSGLYVVNDASAHL